MRLPVEIVRRIREARRRRTSSSSTGSRCSTWSRAAAPGTRSCTLAKAVEEAGATIINTGIGWHEARVPTIVTKVPRAAFAWVTAQAAWASVNIPLITSNRINTPEVAEQILAEGDADMVSMARPFLADPDFVDKAARRPRRRDQHLHRAATRPASTTPSRSKLTTCLVNPRACHETELADLPRTQRASSIAVVGAGPAGLAAATVGRRARPRVTLFERPSEIGGQFNIAMRVPGKEEFAETLRYFTRAARTAPASSVRLDTARRRGGAGDGGYDEIVLATGVAPRDAGDPGRRTTPRCSSYLDVLAATRTPVGERVAVIGAGGIGFDVAEFLVHRGRGAPSLDRTDVLAAEWGVDTTCDARGGVAASKPRRPRRRARSTCCSARPRKVGAGLGKTTGWVHRATLKNSGVRDAHRRATTTASTTTACTSPSANRRAARAGGGQHRALRRPGAAARAAGRSGRSGAERAPDRRRRCGRGAGRQARDQPGFASGG